jgi:hypothetical protein
MARCLPAQAARGLEPRSLAGFLSEWLGDERRAEDVEHWFNSVQRRREAESGLKPLWRARLLSERFGEERHPLDVEQWFDIVQRQGDDVLQEFVARIRRGGTPSGPLLDFVISCIDNYNPQPRREWEAMVADFAARYMALLECVLGYKAEAAVARVMGMTGLSRRRVYDIRRQCRTRMGNVKIAVAQGVAEGDFFPMSREGDSPHVRAFLEYNLLLMAMIAFARF